MAELEQIIVRFNARFDELERSLREIQDKTEKTTKQVGDRFVEMGDRINRAGQTMSTGITAPFTLPATLSTKVASDVEEMRSLLHETFEKATDDVEAWAAATGEAMGRNARFDGLERSLRETQDKAERSLREIQNETERSLREIQDKAEKATKRIGDRFVEMGDRIKRAGQTMSLGITTPFTLLATLSVKAASDVEEMRSLLRETFEEATDDVEVWAAATGEAMGRSRFELMRFAGDFASFLKPLGTAQQALAPMSQALAQLTVDLASFRNLSEQDVLAKLMSGLAGETEALRRLGVDLGQAALDAELLRMGITAAAADVDQATKVMARFNIIMRQTTDAQGDAVRTSDSLSNMLRRLQATWMDITVDLGQILIPIVKQAVAFATELGQAFLDLDPGLKVAIVGIAALTAAIGPALVIIGLTVKAFGLMAGAIGVLLSPITLVVAAVAGLAAAFFLFKGTVIAAAEGVVAGLELWFVKNFRNLVEIPFMTMLNDMIQSAVKIANGIRSLTNQPPIDPAIVADLLAPIPEAITENVGEAFSNAFAHARGEAMREWAEMKALFDRFVPEVPEEIGGDGEMAATIDELLKQLEGVETSGAAAAAGSSKAAGAARDLAERTSEATISLALQNEGLDRMIGLYRDAPEAIQTARDQIALLEEAHRRDIDTTTELGRAWADAYQRNVELSRALDYIENLYRSTRTAQEEYAETVATLNQLLDEGSISLDLYQRGLAQAEQRLKDATETAESSSNIMVEVGQSFESAFEDAIIRGENLGDVLKSLEQDLLRIFLRTQVMKPLMGALFGDGDGSVGLLGDLLGGLFENAQGNVFRNGSIVPHARGGVLSGPTLFPMSNGNIALGGEAGEEALMPLQRMSNGRLGVSAVGATRVNVSVYNNVADAGQARVEQREGPGGRVDIDVVIDRVNSDLINTPGSRTYRALQTTFGASQQLVSR